MKKFEALNCGDDQINVCLCKIFINVLKPFVCLVIPGLSLTAMWTCIAHTGYFVACAVLLTFLRCPAFSRATLLLSVPLNAAAEVNQQPALDLGSLSLLLLALSLGTNPKRMQSQHFWLVFQFVHVTFAGHWFVNQLWAVAQKQKASSLCSYPPSSTPQK